MSQTPDAATRKPRADAERNRAHILAIAERHFAEHGVSGSLDAIAKQAGVGPGTLYRHFPNRDALIAALLDARADALVARREEIREQSPDATQALTRWLEALEQWATAFDGLPEPLRLALDQDASPLALTCQGYVTVTEDFLGAAQRNGGASPQTRARDLFLGVLAISWVRGAAMADERSGQALSELLRDGWASR